MDWIIYGANGYTGKLMAREAARRGLHPILAGRNEGAVSALAADLGLESRVFDLDDPQATLRGVEGCKLVLHCAGPFSTTSQPMIEACLAAGVHYLDITGEISVFQNAHLQADQARRTDIVLIPGVGFDVVPSDCLAASLVEALPAAIKLVLAFEAGGGPSPGTAKTTVEGLGMGGRVRRDGELLEVPLAWKSRTIPFAHADRSAVTIPWGDVYTAFVSTGIPDIEVYMAVSPGTITKMQRMRWFKPLLGLGFVQSFLKKQVENRVRITEYEPPTRLSFSANDGKSEFMQEIRVSPDGNGTLLERRLSFDANPVMGLLFRALSGPLVANPSMNKSLKKLKTNMEKST
ncbi:MAG: saccharopine dehydrogenase NADP-binding domain-containing protein [Lysobacterales bacterium]